MSYQLANGTTIEIESSTGSAIAFTAISNANPAVAATATAHGLTQGDFVRVTSGWSRLSGKLVRVGAVTSTTFALENIDTTSTSLYPAGGGTGSVQEALTFVQIPQITGVTTDGGEQQFFTGQFLESDTEFRLPTVKSASGLTLTVADDPLQPAYPILVAANDSRTARGIRIRLANGSILLYFGLVSVNKTPTLEINTIMEYQVTLSLNNEPVRYAAA